MTLGVLEQELRQQRAAAERAARSLHRGTGVLQREREDVDYGSVEDFVTFMTSVLNEFKLKLKSCTKFTEGLGAEVVLRIPLPHIRSLKSMCRVLPGVATNTVAPYVTTLVDEPRSSSELQHWRVEFTDLAKTHLAVNRRRWDAYSCGRYDIKVPRIYGFHYCNIEASTEVLSSSPVFVKVSNSKAQLRMMSLGRWSVINAFSSLLI